MQKIITPGGETLVVLPIEEYERLVDAGDVAAANRVRADIEAGRDELVPSDVVKRILDGANPVRVWREHRGLSARDLAGQVGISAAYLSEIETGKKDGSLSAMKRIADALGVDLDDLVTQPIYVDAGEAARIVFGGSKPPTAFLTLEEAARTFLQMDATEIAASHLETASGAIYEAADAKRLHRARR